MKKILIVLLLAVVSYANIGKVSTIFGDANIKRGSKTIKVKLGTILEEHDTISTTKKAKLQIIFKDDTIVTLGKNSALKVDDYVYDDKAPKNSKTSLNFFKGSFKSVTGMIGKLNKSKFKLKTKSASIGIRGTTVIGNQEMVAVTSGAITVTAFGKTVFVNKSQVTQTLPNKPPSTPRKMTKNDLKTLSNDVRVEAKPKQTEKVETKKEEKKEEKKQAKKDEKKEESKQEAKKEEPKKEETKQEEPKQEPKQEVATQKTAPTQKTKDTKNDEEKLKKIEEAKAKKKAEKKEADRLAEKKKEDKKEAQRQAQIEACI
jgi:hypothetical protein